MKPVRSKTTQRLQNRGGGAPVVIDVVLVEAVAGVGDPEAVCDVNHHGPECHALLYHALPRLHVN
jgi:hypothetical protein